MRALSVIMILALGAFAPWARATEGMNEATARAAVLARFDAALRGDAGALERLLADDLDYCNFYGTCDSKRDYVETVRSGTLKYSSIEPTIRSVKVFSDSASVLGEVAVTAARGNAAALSVRLTFNAVLAWRDGRWQMTTWTSTLQSSPPGLNR